MGKTKAIIIGISNYSLDGASDLPFCQNDLHAMESVLQNSLQIPKEDILSCGQQGEMTISDFETEINKLSQIANKDDTIIFYFSGHGYTDNGKHYLVFSNGIFHTQKIIEYLEKIFSKSKVIILDCCYSGNFNVHGTSYFDIKKTVDEFNGKGYAIFASSNSSQVSRSHPQKSISLFTDFVWNALQAKFLIKKGKISLHDIQKLVFLYMEIWNKNNPNSQQQPIFRSNMGGTIYFKVADYKPYFQNTFYLEHNDYIIYEVFPMHTGSLKRISAKVILKKPLSINEISNLSIQIIKNLGEIDIYQNKKAENHWKGKAINIIWLHFGHEETDMINNFFFCHATWVDRNQDKKWWYRIDNENSFIMNDVHFKIDNDYYKALKNYTFKNTANKEEIIKTNKEILSAMTFETEKIIQFFNEYLNNESTEKDFINNISSPCSVLHEFFMKSTELDIAPDEIHEWDRACVSIFGTMHDLTYFYNERGLKERTPKNRIDCMSMTIERYYKDLKNLVELESKEN